MKIELDFTSDHYDKSELKVVACYEKDGKDGKSWQGSWSDKELQNHFKELKIANSFTGARGDIVTFTAPEGETMMVVGLGEKKSAKAEQLRRAIATRHEVLYQAKNTQVSALTPFHLTA